MTSGLLVLIWYGMQSISSPDLPPFRSPLMVCDLIVDAGPDTNVCAPGGVVQLQGTITGNDIFFQWSPATGLSNPFILNPIANVTGDITYTLTAFGVDPDAPNLVVNGDFSSGNTGFNSDYNYVNDIPGQQDEMVPEGTYTVINNPSLVHWGFSACNDHTGGNGNMMVINGAANFQDIWCQTVTVDPGQLYNVSAWVASVNPSSPAELQFSINSTPIGPIVNAVATPCVWTPFNAIWNSGGSSTAEICILNLNTALGGNDFALDDISMTALCTVEDEVDITIYEETAPVPQIDGPAWLCEGETAVYTATFPSEPPIYSYTWTVPSGGTILSGQGTPEITILWEEILEDEICLDIETRCDESNGCFEVTVGTYPDLPAIIGPTVLCPGETATFYTPEIHPDDQYAWIIPSELTIISGEGTNEIDVEWSMEGEVEICLEVTNACGTTDNCTLITLYPAYLTLFDTTICEGSTIDINGTLYGNGLWTGTENFLSVHGCDSIVEIEITEAAVLEFFQSISLCPGDSVFLDGAYQTQEGIYIENYVTTEGCDSIVTTTVSITPFDTTLILLSSCNPADTGTVIVHYSMGNCDSTVITTTQLLPTDTTVITLYSCAPSDTGVVFTLLTNQYGCDSLVSMVTLLHPTDTTLLAFTSCDPSDVGVTEQHYMNQFGCDSTVITTTTYLASDTTLLAEPVCIISDTGTTETLLSNMDGCDSLVVLTRFFGGSDTTFISTGSCDLSAAGWQHTTLINQYGCDSTISILTTWLPADTVNIYLTSCSPQDTGLVITYLQNSNGCDSTIFTSTTLLPIHQCSLHVTTDVTQPLCAGEPGEILLTADIGLPPVNVTMTHEATGTISNYVISSVPGTQNILPDQPGKYYITFVSGNGIMETDSFWIDNPPLLDVVIMADTDAHGFHIPCHGDSTASAYAHILSPGIPPLTFAWSNGAFIDSISGLSAGIYSLDVTDANGCMTQSTIQIIEPPLISFLLNVDPVRCFGENNGAVYLHNINGGVPPMVTSLDSGPWEQTTSYFNLMPGQHHLQLSDQQGCLSEVPFSIDEPLAWDVSLGPDTLIDLGSAYEVSAMISGTPVAPLTIDWSNGLCADCLTRNIIPAGYEEYEVVIRDALGCVQSDDIALDVYINRDLYVPNVFSPNGDGINDVFLVSSGGGVTEIESMTIYDRWGEIVFSRHHILPDDVNASWDGSVHGQTVNPGVFAYILNVRYKDGRLETRYGDITLVR